MIRNFRDRNTGCGSYVLAELAALLRRSLLSLAAVTAACVIPALAEDAVPQTGSGSSAETGTQQPIEEVIVRGRRLSEIDFDLRAEITNFVRQIAAPARARGYARWHKKVCVGVYNLEEGPAQYIVDRLSSLALDLGLEAGEPGCEPGVNIIFAADGRQMAASMVEAEPRVFRPVMGNEGMDLGLAALDDFTGSERPVRWWHVSLPVDARTGVSAIEVVPTCPALHCPPVIAVDGPSRLHSGIEDALQYVIVIVDASMLTGTSWKQLADYLALVSLAQIKPTTDPQAFDSILNLFSNPAAYSGLTDWDLSYLHALYEFNQERIPRLQRNEIVNIIAKRESGAAR